MSITPNLTFVDPYLRPTTYVCAACIYIHTHINIHAFFTYIFLHMSIVTSRYTLGLLVKCHTGAVDCSH